MTIPNQTGKYLFKVNNSDTNAYSIVVFVMSLWHRGVVVITAAQLYSTKPELRFCTSSNLADGVSEIRDGENLCQ